MASYDSTKYWHVLGKLGKIVQNLDWFRIQVVLPFEPILPWDTLTIDTNDVICLIAASSVQDIDD